MKYLKYAFIATIFGVFFTLGTMLAFKLIVPLFVNDDPDLFYKEELSRVEEEIGGSCLELYDDSYQFAVNDVGEIINIGIKGGDWIKVITAEQKQLIDSYNDLLFECVKAKYSADRLGKDWPEFDKLQNLYSSLQIYSTRYGSGEPSSNDLKPEALNHIMFEYRNVTTR